GIRRQDGTFLIEARGRQAQYGPLRVRLDGKIERPKVELPAQKEQQTLDVLKDNTPLPATLHAWRAPKETDPDAYPIELLGSVLSDGRSSRLYRRLVEKEQAAVEVEAFPFLLENAGLRGVLATGQRDVTLDQLDKLI
ncbi:MAG: insulinase family protein, partial [Verrucomicrobiota bacterium]